MEYFNITSKRFMWFMCVLGGLFAGLGLYTVYISRAWFYVSDDPAACLNCHIMASYYQDWNHSSHRAWTTCNDCHVPQDSLLSKYTLKAVDGLYHSAVFTVGAEPQVIRAREASSRVILENCLRCHKPLVTELVKMEDRYEDALQGRAATCWECHTQVPHTNISNLASAPGALVPFPASPVPEWLSNMTKQ
ncbi:MAG: cytochrome c nitrite reductase small subunit [Candidatus Adiutrix sp.]|nr:cytochrome c nitrite reductase small subunit [Candidatus Adiutrix sp.]